MERRDFLSIVLGGGTAGAILAVTACADDAGPSVDAAVPVDAAASCTDHGTIAVFAGNHGHALVVSAEEVRSPSDRVYDITGGADHPHSVTVTREQFAMLATNASVNVTSSRDDGHMHTITIRCR